MILLRLLKAMHKNKVPVKWKWQKIIGTDRENCLSPDDEAYSLGYHYSRKDPRCNDLSNQIGNFKKPPSAKGKDEWYYREQAVKMFAERLAEFLKNYNQPHLFLIE